MRERLRTVVPASAPHSRQPYDTPDMELVKKSLNESR